MGANTNIQWANFSFNPVIGCTRVSPACDRCYAAAWAKIYEPNVKWGEPGQKVAYRLTAPANWRMPHRWNKLAAKTALLDVPRPRVFCASLSDVFDNGWDPQWRKDLWDLIDATPYLDWLLLTKRPQNIHEMLPADWGDKGWDNVWLGTTVENQTEAERRIPHLLSVPAHVHFLSCEPLLGPLKLTPWLYGSPQHPGIDWIIIGGESGPGFRMMDMNWVADLRVQCRDAKVPVFFKQDSSKKPGSKGRASPELWACKNFPVSH